MLQRIIQVLVVVSLGVFASVWAAENDVQKKLKTDGIIPSIVPDVPLQKLAITYPNGKVVNLGNELAVTDVQETPRVSWTEKAGKFYTLLAFDPDAPERKNPSSADYKHWFVGNIPAKNVTSGEVIADYKGPAPAKATGLHRYIFLLYEHANKIDLKEEPRSPKISSDHRVKWSVKQVVKKYNLGNPVAANYFQAKTV